MLFQAVHGQQSEMVGGWDKKGKLQSPPLQCPAGSKAIGLKGNRGGWLNSVALVCSKAETNVHDFLDLPQVTTRKYRQHYQQFKIDWKMKKIEVQNLAPAKFAKWLKKQNKYSYEELREFLIESNDTYKLSLLDKHFGKQVEEYHPQKKIHRPDSEPAEQTAAKNYNRIDGVLILVGDFSPVIGLRF